MIRFTPAHPGAEENETRFEPRESIAHSAEWMAAVREEVGRSPVLGIDYHHRLSVAEAASFCQRMPEGTLDFLEEPIRCETPDAYAALRQMIRAPLAIGEEFSSKWAFVPYIERGLTNFARIDICNVGGFTEGMKVAGWSEAHYIDMMPHNPLGPISTAAHIHFGAAVSNFAGWRIGNTSSRSATSSFPSSIVWMAAPIRCRKAPGSAWSSTRRWRKPLRVLGMSTLVPGGRIIHELVEGDLRLGRLKTVCFVVCGTLRQRSNAS